MDALARDLKYAVRSLWKNPAFALTAIFTIALGIGSSTAIFSVVNAVLLRPLPYAEPQRLATIWTDMRNRNVVDFPLAPGDLVDLRGQGTLFEGIAGLSTTRIAMGAPGEEAEMIPVAAVTTDFFHLLGARFLHGRDFVEEDGTPNTQPQQGQPASPPLPTMAVLSYGYWQRRFGGDPAIVGQTIPLGNGRAEVVGVLAPGFEILFPPDTNVERDPVVWTAMRVDFATGSRINVFLRLVGRLKPGVTFQQAQSQLDGISADLRQRFPIKETAGYYLRLEPMHKDLVDDVRSGILALMGAVMFVLLIACANVANLLLVRTSARERELAVRAAVGASQRQLMRQMLAESLVLAGGGVLTGLALAQLGVNLLLLLKPDNLPRLEQVNIDPLVMGFAVLAAVAAAAMFGLVPALRASRPNLMEVLRRSGQTSGLAPNRLLRNAVVVAEVALSFVLLIGAGLMIRSFIALQNTDPGYDPKGVLTMFVPNPRGMNQEQRGVFKRELQQRLAALPGVQGVAASSPFPLDGRPGLLRWGTEAAVADPNAFQQAAFFVVLPGYFEMLHTRLIEGRTFTEAENVAGTHQVVVDKHLAAKGFPNQSAVGKRILMRTGGDQPEWFEIIGVVAHQRHASYAVDGREAVYFPNAYFGNGPATRWGIRTSGDPALLATAARAQVAGLDPSLPVTEVQPMMDYVERAQAPTKFALILIGVFAGIAVVLAAVGLYGVLSTVVRQRTAEIGVRMAFGASQSNILKMILGQGMKLSLIGIAGGLIGAFALTRGMSSLLVDVAPTDPVTYAGIAVLFLAVAAASSWIPARRASTLDPMVALRDE